MENRSSPFQPPNTCWIQGLWRKTVIKVTQSVNLCCDFNYRWSKAISWRNEPRLLSSFPRDCPHNSLIAWGVLGRFVAMSPSMVLVFVKTPHTKANLACYIIERCSKSNLRSISIFGEAWISGGKDSIHQTACSTANKAWVAFAPLAQMRRVRSMPPQ